MKTCAICGSEEHPEWKAHVFKSHVFASNNASNGASNNASNGASNNASNIVQVLPLAVQPKTITKSTHRAGSKQRWARVDYNAYQRDLMRKRRALQK
jgi:hypothetical protein